MGELLNGRIAAKAGCGIGRLSRRRRDETLEEAPDSPFSKDNARSVEKAFHAWAWRFAVIDSGHLTTLGITYAEHPPRLDLQRCLDTLKGCDSQQ